MSHSAYGAVLLGFIPGSLCCGGSTSKVSVGEGRPELKNIIPWASIFFFFKYIKHFILSF